MENRAFTRKIVVTHSYFAIWRENTFFVFFFFNFVQIERGYRKLQLRYNQCALIWAWSKIIIIIRRACGLAIKFSLDSYVNRSPFIIWCETGYRVTRYPPQRCGSNSVEISNDGVCCIVLLPISVREARVVTNRTIYEINMLFLYTYTIDIIVKFNTIDFIVKFINV